MRVLVALVAVSLCSTALAGCASKPPPPSEKSPLLSGVLPGFQSTTVSGRQLSTGEFHGRPFVVSVVASGCEPCERSLRETQAMYEDDHDVPVVGVYQGDTGGALRLTHDLNLKFPVVVDEDGAISRRFELDAFPRTFVADSQGRVAWVGGEALTRDALASAVASVE